MYFLAAYYLVGDYAMFKGCALNTMNLLKTLINSINCCSFVFLRAKNRKITFYVLTFYEKHLSRI